MQIQRQLNKWNSLMMMVMFLWKNLGDDNNATDVGNGDQSMFDIAILEKIKEMRSKFFPGSATVLQKMTNCQEARVKLTNTQWNKLKFAAKNKTGTILKLNKKNFGNEELPHDLFLTWRQTTKARHVFVNNISTDIKLNKAEISKINQLGGSLDSYLDSLGKTSLANIAIPLARGNLLWLVGNLTSNAINKFESKISGKSAVRLRKGFPLFF